MKLSLRALIAVIMLCFAIAQSIGNFLYFNLFTEKEIIREQRNHLSQFMNITQGSINQINIKQNIASTHRLLNTLLTTQYVTDAFVVGSNLNIIASANKKNIGTPILLALDKINSSTFDTAREKLQGQILDVVDCKCFLSVFPVYPEDANQITLKTPDFLVIKYDYENALQTAQYDLENILLLNLSYVLLITSILWLFFHKAITTKINKLMIATEKLSKGELSVRTGISGNNELGKLGGSIDMMAKSLVENNKQLFSQQQALNSHSIVATTNAEGVITYVNDKFCEISQFSRNELIGKTHKIINSSIHPKTFWKEFWETISSGSIWHGEITNKKKNGDFYYVETTIVPFVNDSGKPTQYIAIRTDVTEQVESKRVLQQEQKRLQTINNIQLQHFRKQNTETSFSNILKYLVDFTKSDSGFIASFSDNKPPNILANINFDANVAFDLLLSDPNSIIKKTLDTHNLVIDNFSSKETNKTRVRLSIPLIIQDKILGFLVLENDEESFNKNEIDSWEPVIYTCSQLIHALRSEEKQRFTEALLENETTFLNAVLAHLHEGIIACDNDGNLTVFNDAARSFHQYFPGELNQADWKNYFTLYRDDGVTPLLKDEMPLARALNGEEFTDSKIVIAPLNSSPLHILASGNAFFDEQGNRLGAVVSMQNVTERREMQQKLEQAQKMETMGQLTGGIAHDFNNILASIMGYTELSILRMSTDNTEKIPLYLEQIQQASERARDLIAQMLMFGKIEATDGMPSTLSLIVAEVKQLLVSTLPSNISIKANVAEKLPQVEISPIKMHQILMNMCVNARDAIGENGNIQINVDKIEIKSETCSACGESFQGEYIAIEIADDGKGIQPQFLDKIFDPFFTTKKEQGTGIGLAVTRDIIHDAHGHIRITSTDNIGTTFRIYLPPLSAHEATIKEHIAIPTLNLRGNNERIMVVDDEAMIGRFEAELLSSHGYESSTEIDSTIALQKFMLNPDEYDLFILDQTMPALSGLELAKSILSRRPNLPIIICTGFSESVNEEIARNAGIQGFLTKPVDSVTLLTLIQTLLTADNSKDVT